MRCPFCHDNQDKVIDSRAADGGKVIRRRRQCLACGKRFTTRELVDDSVRLTVVKKDASRVPYERAKLIKGIEVALYKRKVPAEAITQLVDEVEDELFRQGSKEVPSLDIGQRVSGKLKRLDAVAYIRYASVYMQFGDVDDLIAEAQEVKAAIADPPEPDQGALF